MVNPGTVFVSIRIHMAWRAPKRHHHSTPPQSGSNDRSLNPCLCTQNFEEPPFPCRLTPKVRQSQSHSKARAIKEGRIWTYVRDDRPWGGTLLYGYAKRLNLLNFLTRHLFAKSLMKLDSGCIHATKSLTAINTAWPPAFAR